MKILSLKFVGENIPKSKTQNMSKLGKINQEPGYKISNLEISLQETHETKWNSPDLEIWTAHTKKEPEPPKRNSHERNVRVWKTMNKQRGGRGQAEPSKARMVRFKEAWNRPSWLSEFLVQALSQSLSLSLPISDSSLLCPPWNGL